MTTVFLTPIEQEPTVLTLVLLTGGWWCCHVLSLYNHSLPPIYAPPPFVLLQLVPLFLQFLPLFLQFLLHLLVFSRVFLTLLLCTCTRKLRRSSHGVNHGGSMIANDQWKYSCQCYHCYHEWVCDFMWPWKRLGNDQEHRVAKQKSSTAYIYIERERGGEGCFWHTTSLNPSKPPCKWLGSTKALERWSSKAELGHRTSAAYVPWSSYMGRGGPLLDTNQPQPTASFTQFSKAVHLTQFVGSEVKTPIFYIRKNNSVSLHLNGRT